ncbi:urea ABC transporter permease subunit UrtB [Betaproteobacteria bacterium GR16-43]|nr:urea ABC transporter permease subunit UrtB [Betaproteobacteria bacterium GR16-43]
MRALLQGLALLCVVLASPVHAVEPALAQRIAAGDNDEKVAVLAKIVAAADPKDIPFLKALAEGTVTVDGKPVEVTVNNRLRKEIDGAIAALKLVDPDHDTRLAAAKELSNGAEPSVLPAVRKALAVEKDAEIQGLLASIAASLGIRAGDKAERLAAIKTLGSSNSPTSRALLTELKDEPDLEIRAAAQRALKEVEGRLAWAERAGLLFAGISLGSILLLAALGLAITYGLMGVINMAHGELIMIGAYTTYLVQNLFRAHFPGAFDAYLLFAVPSAFLASMLVGMALERCVVRFLYGRPLETLLATWGISLMLIQTVRTIFGAQNVQVENPSWMSGGLEILSGVVLPYSRIVIIAFAVAVLAGIGLLLAKTRLGLFVRGVTQNRAMASCVGVPTARVDLWAFGLGSGLAGLAGCALSQIGNVGPDLGQSYIVDSFLVVVLGGVGQLAGTVLAALGLGIMNKLLETWAGAVIAKIVVLVFIILFIQKRPQGLFAMKGRSVES